MFTALIIVIVPVIYCLVRLNLWHCDYIKEKNLRRSRMSDDERRQAEFEDWSDDQW